MTFIPRPQEIYKHFKGNLYQITAIAEHSEKGEQLVIYQALYGDFKTYARPLELFVSRVDREKYPNVTQEFRFELQGADSDRQRTAMSGVQDAAMSQKRVTQSPQTTERAKEQDTETQEVISAGTDTVTEAEELGIDPMVLEFLDADSYEQRLNILAGLHHRITNEMITTMAIACDLEVEDGDVEERFESLKSCLITRERYECNRMR